MLHITSFVQNIAKLNNKNKSHTATNHNPTDNLLNGINRNYSFIYDHNLKRYDYHYDETEEQDLNEGYWGYLRDRNADTKQSAQDNDNKPNSHDGYWGHFKDVNFTDRSTKAIDIGGGVDEMKVGSPDSAGMSLSSSISSLSRFVDYEREDDCCGGGGKGIFEGYAKKLEYDYNFKTSKLKIQACKRDEMKILMQSLEDQESKFKKEVIKSFDTNYLTTTTIHSNPSHHPISSSPSSSSASSTLTYSTKVKQINFLHFSNNNNKEPTTRNLNNFKIVFNCLTKLKKSINVFNGDLLNVNRGDLFLSFVNSVHASMNDVNGFVYNYLYEKNQVVSRDESAAMINQNNDVQRQTTNVSLCSNIYEMIDNMDNSPLSENNQKLFGSGNYSTMLFEYQNVKIGFMALIDPTLFHTLNTNIANALTKNPLDQMNSNLEYVDYISECDKLSRQLRLCGANLIVVLTNMDDLNEERLLNEGNDLDIVFSSGGSLVQGSEQVRKAQSKEHNRWIVRSGQGFDCVSMVSLKLDELNSNRILDVEIVRYLIE